MDASHEIDPAADMEKVIALALTPRVGDMFVRGDAIVEIVRIEDGVLFTRLNDDPREQAWNLLRWHEHVRATITRGAMFLPHT